MQLSYLEGPELQVVLVFSLNQKENAWALMLELKYQVFVSDLDHGPLPVTDETEKKMTILMVLG